MSLSFASSRLSALRKRLDQVEAKVAVRQDGGHLVVRLFGADMSPIGEHPSSIGRKTLVVNIVAIPAGKFLPNVLTGEVVTPAETPPTVAGDDYADSPLLAYIAEQNAVEDAQVVTPWPTGDDGQMYLFGPETADVPKIDTRLAPPPVPELIDAPEVLLPDLQTVAVIADTPVKKFEGDEAAKEAKRLALDAELAAKAEAERKAMEDGDGTDMLKFTPREAMKRLTKNDRLRAELKEKGVDVEDRPPNIGTPMVMPDPLQRDLAPATGDDFSKFFTSTTRH